MANSTVRYWATGSDLCLGMFQYMTDDIKNDIKQEMANHYCIFLTTNTCTSGVILWSTGCHGRLPRVLGFFDMGKSLFTVKPLFFPWVERDLAEVTGDGK